MPVSLSKERPVIARFQRQLRLAEPLVFEQMLSVNSVSVLIYMILTDPDFVPDSGPMGLLALYGPRLAWEWLVGIGAVLKPLGLAICLLKGGSADMSTVMIAVEKADVAFQLMMQVRNKIVSAYQDIEKMQF